MKKATTNLIGQTEVKFLNNLLLSRDVSDTHVKQQLRRMEKGLVTERQYFLELLMSSDFLKSAVGRATEFHLYYIHFARIKMISTLVPEAKVIVDLGGANGSLYDMGYPYKFEKITVVDLPPEDRDDMYKQLKLKQKKTPNGPIEVHYGDMSDLSFLPDNSVDLVWSGESIEHITEAAAEKTIKEAFRVLKPGGYFCLDTPNRFITEIHTRDAGVEFIHPEHKIEYYPKPLRKKLRAGGFRIVERKGICEMPRTYRSKIMDYSDFVMGSPVTDRLDAAYIQYYTCQKPGPRLEPYKRKAAAVRNRLRK